MPRLLQTLGGEVGATGEATVLLNAVKDIFTSGTTGGVWLPTASSMFSDSGGTTAATVGGVVGLVSDQIGGGNPWTLSQRLGSETYVYAFLSLGGGVVLAGTGTNGGVYRSVDYGKTWTFCQRLGSETQALCFANAGNGVVIAGSGTGKVYRSTDSGVTWDAGTALGSVTGVQGLASDGNGVIVAGTSAGGLIYRSADGGQNWSLIQQLATETFVFCITRLDNGHFLAGTFGQGKVFISTDNGLTWDAGRRVGTNSYIKHIADLGGGVVVANTYTGRTIYKSLDYGQTWNLAGTISDDIWAFCVTPSGSILAGVDVTSSVYRSTDGGSTWSLVQKVGASARVVSLLGLGNGIVLAGTATGGEVHRSVIDGARSSTAIQTTEAYKPTLRRAPTSGKLFSDCSPASVALTASFGSSLGSDCSVFYVTPEGVTKLAAQTISTTYNLLTQYRYWGGTVVVNRATTAAEDAIISLLLQMYVPQLGNNLFANPGFDADADWTKGTGWSIGAGVASRTAGTASNLTQSVGVSGSPYYVKGDVTVTAGTIGAYPGSGTTQFGSTAATGVMAHTMRASGSGIGVRGDASFAGSIDNAVIKEIV